MALGFMCDFCTRPLEIESVNGTNTHVTYATKEWNTKQLYPYLCKSCAGKLDITIRKVKDEAVLGNLIAARNTRLNNERKQKLGTKG